MVSVRVQIHVLRRGLSRDAMLPCMRKFSRGPWLCSYYIGYKSLKKRIKYYSGRAHASTATEDERHEIVKSFSELLDSQVGTLE